MFSQKCQLWLDILYLMLTVVTENGWGLYSNDLDMLPQGVGIPTFLQTEDNVTQFYIKENAIDWVKHCE